MSKYPRLFRYLRTRPKIVL
jgi:hypothetical protein